MSYFSEQYSKLGYPQANDNSDNLGLRNAQIGAIHAIASHATLESNAAAIVVMPTGSGKTAVLMMAPYVLRKSKVLIVTPSAMVRGQICDDFQGLKTLKRIGVFDSIVPNPVVYQAAHEYTDEHVDEYEKSINCADVVVATHHVAATISEHLIKSTFDYVIIDEAHHVPASTWEKILCNMSHADSLLVTATPFRLDGKEIKGDHVYSYPLSKAYRDGIFGEIVYIPIEEASDKDRLIAQEAERVFLNDKEQGYDHRLMVRTNTKEKAKELEDLYKEVTGLRLKRIDSNMAYNTVKRAIEQMLKGEIDGIICVNMLGEGFDFPNMKIAAIHEPHKSLSSTLQFIGRFARTNAENIGTAKFIAMNDATLRIENLELYSSDAIWQDIIINMSEQRINANLNDSETFKQFVGPDIDEDSSISLNKVRPNCHAKIFKIGSFNDDGNFPEICRVENRIYRNRENHTVVGIAHIKESPLWLEGNQIYNVDIHLFIVHYQRETSLLFIYSQDKSEVIYKQIADAFTTVDYKTPQKLPRNEMNRVLGELQDYEFFNTGMQNRYAEAGESYRIIAGSNTAASIDESTGKMVSAGHAFCKARKGDEEITIGYSSGSKIWSSSYLQIPDYIAWCDENGLKIANSKMIVKTNTNYDMLPLPEKVIKYPSNILFSLFSEKTYLSPPTLCIGDNQITKYLITDLDIKVTRASAESVFLEAGLKNIVEVLSCNIEGNYESKATKFWIRDGQKQISLADYLNEHPLIFKTSDDTVIISTDLFVGNPKAIVFKPDHIIPIPWKTAGTDIKNECGKETEKGVSIQTALRRMLENNTDLSHIIFDHGTGEIADFITFQKTEEIIHVSLYHVKSMKGKNYNKALEDVYEVSQQAVKSIIWLKSKNVLLNKIISRIKGKADKKFVRGDLNTLKTMLRGNLKMEANIYIVQPAISPDSKMPEKLGEILAAATYYINHSGRVKELKVLGSKQ